MHTQRASAASIRRAVSVILLAAFAAAQSGAEPAANSLSAADIPNTETAAPWLRPALIHALRSPQPAGRYTTTTTPAVIPRFQVFANLWGLGGNYQPGGPVTTANNAFFQPFGNGRSCLTCHQPANAFSVTPEFVKSVFVATSGKDPLFAPVDGANCPNQVPAAATSGALLGGAVGSGKDLRAAYSLLLERGLFRIFLPVPKVTNGLNPRPTEYTIELVSDPYSCNTDPAYNRVTDPTTGEVTQIISVYRRPLITSNLKFKTSSLQSGGIIPPINPETREPLPIDPLTGEVLSLNLMWDGRDLTLQDQAVNAVLIHAQSPVVPTPEQVLQMLAFQNGVFSAQEALKGVNLSSGANGGSQFLSTREPLKVPGPFPPFEEFTAWESVVPTTPNEALQASIARGEMLFNTTLEFPTQIGTVRVQNCATCHGQSGNGSEASAAGQRNTGVGGQSVASNGPAPDPTLPIFKLTCVAGATTGNDGSVVFTNDPGLALISGKCVDIGKFTTPSIRGLLSRAPYFHDGSARTVLDIVNFYERRFSIVMTAQDKQDLVNFLSAL